MGLQIRTYVEGKQRYLDLFGNETIDIEVSFAEIQDITKKNSAFTKEFRVPGSKNNNEIFNYFFDINSVYLDWNPKKKFEADLLYDGFELYNGYVRMNSVSINKTEKTYSVSFYNAVGDVVANIGDKALCEVDTTPVNYFTSALTISNETASILWTADPSFQNISTPIDYVGTGEWYGVTKNDPLVNGDVCLMLGQRGYDYTGSSFNDIRDIDTTNTPILEFSGVPGFFDYFQSTGVYPSAVNLAYLIPSLRVRKLYELIMKDAGYSIDSEFFATDYFGRQYLPLSFNTESVYLAQSRDYDFQFYNTTGTTAPTESYEQFYAELDNLSGPRIDAFLDFIFPNDIVFENLGYNPGFPPADPAVGGLNYAMFKVPQSQFKVVVSCTTECLFDDGDPSDRIIGDGVVGTSWYVNPGNIIQGEVYSAFPIMGNSQFIGAQVQNSFTSTTISSIGLQGAYDWTFLAFEPQNDFKIIDIRLTIIGESQALPEYVRLNEEMSCEIKQMDFIQNINKMFNLVVVEHPIKPNTLIVEPMIDYIGKGQVLDWTSKVDWDSSITLTPTSSIINGSIFLANKMDKDFINTQFNSRSNLIFGQNIINLGEDYKNAQTNLTQTLGQNTDYYLNASGTTNPALPCFFITKQNNTNGKVGFEFRPFRSLPRITFRGFPIQNNAASQNSWYIRFGGNVLGMAYYQNFNRLTTYPSALSGFSHYLTYNSTDSFTPDELIYPEVMTQYDMFYRDYIEDLTSPENKIMSCKMYLTPWEVSQLYYNEKIIIKNAYWRINKISGLSLIEPGLCNVELVKLTRDYTPFPIKFYDLIPCDCNAEVIHTNTDLIYHIYAFEGQYVDVALPPYTISPSLGPLEYQPYKVLEVEFNENYTYTTPFLAYLNSGINSNKQGMNPYVANSGCTQQDDIEDLYWPRPINEFLTGSGIECEPFTVTNTGTSRSTFYFENCSGDTSSWTLDPNEGLNICLLYGKFTGDTFSVCLDEADCSTSTPLPTPTPTLTPFLSPTPTPSPTATMTTPTPTPTPSSTPPSVDCTIDYIINIVGDGWIKYTTCGGFTNYEYVVTSQSPYTLNACVETGSLLPGFPFMDIAFFNITDIGTPC
jgi:hypothetical protein